MMELLKLNNENYLGIIKFVERYGSITNEICKNIFYNTEFGYDSSRRALNKLVDKKLLKKHKDLVTGTYIYYKTTAITTHKLQGLRLYSYIYAAADEVIEFSREYKCLKYISDGLVTYKINGITKILIIEIDINHKTTVEKYESLFDTGYFQEKFGTFPRILIADANFQNRKKKLKSDKVLFECIDFNFTIEGIRELL